MMRAGTVADLRGLLADAADRHQVPGAVLAVLDGDEIEEAAFGIANVATGVEVTPDTLFQIGSISKLYTATLAMQLVEEGLVALDAPVTDVIPSFAVEPPDQTALITLRTLLTHTSGLEGDVFDDHGRGDDCLERFVDALTGTALISPVRAMFSYCNTGVVLVGRMIEVLRDRIWDVALRERVFAPLALERSVTLPEEAIMHRVAIGHHTDPETGAPVRAPVWHLPRATGPAGAIASTARDVLSFARMHLDGGRAPDGGRVLSEDSVRAMQQQQVEAPYLGRLASACGISWMLSDWDGVRVIGHNGGTFGQTAFMRMIPEQRFAVCLLTNSRNGPLMALDVLGEVFGARGLTIPGPAEATEGLDVDLARFEGRYVRANLIIDLAMRDGRLVASVTPGGLLTINTQPTEDIPLDVIDQTTLLLRMPAPQEAVPVSFLFEDGEPHPRYLHTGGRVSKRV